MEAMVKKYQQKFRKVRDEMNRWDELQCRLISQFRNASSIIERLQVVLAPDGSTFYTLSYIYISQFCFMQNVKFWASLSGASRP